MTHDTAQNGGRFGGIGDEAIYLRINQLQKGMLQFTDTINAWSLRYAQTPKPKSLQLFGRTLQNRRLPGPAGHREIRHPSD
jgi:hypothetical protein